MYMYSVFHDVLDKLISSSVLPHKYLYMYIYTCVLWV